MANSKNRRTTEQIVADLEAKIAALKAKAARKQLKANPAVRHTTAAIRSIDKAIDETTAPSMRKALQDARSTLSACLAVDGIVVANEAKQRVRRSGVNIEQLADALLEHVEKHPGQRGEQIAAALGTDVGTMRRPMKQLISEKKVKTKGQRRGMAYFAS